MSELINKVDSLLELHELGDVHLTDWEFDFILDQAERIELGKGIFSDNEAAKINQIYAERVGR